MAPFRWRAPARLLVLLAAAAPLAAAGCGHSTATVSGTVSYKGTKLKGGNITFISNEGKPSDSARIGEDGSYTIAKAPTGSVKITVETESLRPRRGGPPPGIKNTPPTDKVAEGFKVPDPNANAKLYVPIPPEYASPETTPLTYTVKSGGEPYNIELKDK